MRALSSFINVTLSWKSPAIRHSILVRFRVAGWRLGIAGSTRIIAVPHQNWGARADRNSPAATTSCRPQDLGATPLLLAYYPLFLGAIPLFPNGAFAQLFMPENSGLDTMPDS